MDFVRLKSSKQFRSSYRTGNSSATEASRFF